MDVVALYNCTTTITYRRLSLLTLLYLLYYWRIYSVVITHTANIIDCCLCHCFIFYCFAVTAVSLIKRHHNNHTHNKLIII